MAIPVTQVRTSHALTIRAKGQTVGLINSWSPSQSRTVTAVYELGSDNSGNPVENMPGNVTGLTLNINRYDTYVKRMENVFGTRDLMMLTSQSNPFDLFESWKVIPPGVSTNAVLPFVGSELFIYRGCWFSSLGRNITSTGDRVVNVNATIVYTQKIKAQGVFGEVARAASEFSF